MRDAGALALLEALHLRLHSSLGWATEVVLRMAGDQRAWDAMVRAPSWRYGVEAELGPNDSQALQRRIELKIRDGNVNGAILLLPETRRARAFLEVARPALASTFPIPARVALAALGEGGIRAARRSSCCGQPRCRGRALLPERQGTAEAGVAQRVLLHGTRLAGQSVGVSRTEAANDRGRGRPFLVPPGETGP